ncbi:MAG: hypothetical protein ACC656_11945, partial [Candidatus Heimdallarchaeota archaeon]
SERYRNIFLPPHFNFDISVEYSGIANYIYVNGWKWDGNSNYNMNSLIKFNRTQGGEYTFSLAFIRSNIEFGTTNYTLDSAKEQAGTYQNVVDFYNNYTVNEVRVDQWLIKDDFRISIEEENKLSGLKFGYYFVVRYQSWEYFEYRDTVTIGVTPTSDSTMPDIEIIYDESPWYEVILSDSTGAFVKEYGTVSRNYSYEEITNIVLSDPEIIDWIANLNTVTLYLYYNGYGLFYVDISTNNWFDRANFIISDETGEILSKNIQKAIYATKSSQDILSIALSNPKISDWVLNTENYRVNYNYDFNGQWYLNFFDPIISDSWADLLINDTNGEILWAESYVGRSPEMTKDEVINAALSTDLSEFYIDYPDAKISMFYSYDDLWWVYVYSPIVLEEYILIQINDNTG